MYLPSFYQFGSFETNKRPKDLPWLNDIFHWFALVPNSRFVYRCEPLTLFDRRGGLLCLVAFALALVRDLAAHGAGHVELVDVQRGLAEGRHGRVHACIAVGGGAAQGGQVQRFAPQNRTHSAPSYNIRHHSETETKETVLEGQLNLTKRGSETWKLFFKYLV